MQVPRRSTWASIAAAAYVLSLFLPAGRGEYISIPGICCVVIGWLVPLPWSANVFMLVACIARGHGAHRWALASSLVAVFTALTTLSLFWEVGVGFYVWVGSMVAMVIASVLSITEPVEPIARAQATERLLRT